MPIKFFRPVQISGTNEGGSNLPGAQRPFFRLSVCSLLIFATLCSLCSCGTIDREFRLRRWEQCRFWSRKALASRHLREARSLAEEAVSQSNTWASDDFRLGVSLADLAEVERKQGKGKDAEKTYKKAIEVLKSAVKSDKAELSNTKQDAKSLLSLVQTLAREELGNTASRLADLYAINSRWKDACKYFKLATASYESLILSKEQVDDFNLGQELVRCLMGLAQCALELKDTELACSSYKRALDLALESKSSEFIVQEIREKYLQALKQAGKEEEQKVLSADITFNELLREGTNARARENWAEAEEKLKQAVRASRKSQISKAYFTRAISNLTAVLYQQRKLIEVESYCLLANRLVESGEVPYDNEFDQMLYLQANMFNQLGRYQEASAILNKQIKFRVKEYGKRSRQVCELLASRGRSLLLAGNKQGALNSALLAYRYLNPHLLSDKRANTAIYNTSLLLTDLDRPREAIELQEELCKQQIKRMEEHDPRIVTMHASRFVLYLRFGLKEKCQEAVNDILAELKNATAKQKAASFPYLVLILSYAMKSNMPYVAEPIAICGQSILKNELANEYPDENCRINWGKDIAKLEAQLGKKL